MLQYQFTARYYYNLAEKINTLLWGICTLTLLVALIPTLNDYDWINVLLLICDILLFILAAYHKALVTRAANIRAVFDDYVFGISSTDFSSKEINHLNEIVFKTIRLHTEEAQIQINNTGIDTPPGVKNWYESTDNFSVQNPILFCQKQNIFWTQKMIITKVIYTFVEFLLLFTIVALVWSLSEISIITTLLGFFGFIVKIIERIFENIKYIICYIKIQGVIETLESSCSSQNIVTLQKAINNMRAIPVTGKNFIHKKLANRLSILFKETVIK